MITWNTDPATGVVHLTIGGKITRKDLDATIEAMKARIATGKRLKIVETILDIDGVEPLAIWDDLRFGWPLTRSVSRAAVVTDLGWVRTMTGLGAHLVAAEVKVFHLLEAEAAKQWVEAG